jgi:glutamine cyclotransferase
VLNGIAYDATTGLFYITGKRWRVIFSGRFH